MEGLENNKIHMIFYTNHKIDIPEKKNGKQNHSVKKKKKKIILSISQSREIS